MLPRATHQARHLGRLSRGFVLVLAWLVVVLAGPVLAQAPQGPAENIRAGQAELTQVRRQLRTTRDDEALTKLRDRTSALQAKADTAADALAPRLVGIDARLAQIGPAPKSPTGEAPEIRAERQNLTQTRTAVDGEIKQAKLLSLSAQQTADRITDLRRSAFNSRIFSRGDSPLSPGLWTVLARNLPGDLNRLRRAGLEEATAARGAFNPRSGLILLISLLVALVFTIPVRLWLERLGRRWAIKDAPPTRLRRSGVAVWRVLIGTLAPSMAALSLLYGLTWAGALSPRGHDYAVVATVVTVWMALVASLGTALLSPGKASWRLAPLSDETVERARLYPFLIGLVSGVALLLERLNSLVGASLAATVASNAVITFAYSALAIAVLVSVGRGRAQPEGSGDAAAVARTSAWSLMALAVGLAVSVALIAVLAGYTAFGVFVVRQVIWISVLAGFIYLLVTFVDDLFSQLFCPTGHVGRAIYVVFALRPSTIDQLGVVLSALVRLAILLFGLSAILAPFGAGAGGLANQLETLATGVKVGGVVISPAAVLGAAAAFVIGVMLVRGVQRWLNAEYLPKTEWDPGVRNSVSTAVGYLGIGLAAAWALASMGLGLQRVALIASALSVGIGFGLQTIVQNFISGVIMLIERPVKVGDWVLVGTLEGDIQRIDVRATEIQMFDKSTLLVPNSEFITKPVQNKTRGNPPGRIQIQFGVAAETDMDRVQAILQAAYGANGDVLSEPAPTVYIDAVTESGIQLNSYAYVSNPRAVYATRSALFFDILRRLREAGIELAAAQQNLRITAAPGLAPLYAAAAGQDPAQADTRSPVGPPQEANAADEAPRPPRK